RQGPVVRIQEEVADVVRRVAGAAASTEPPAADGDLAALGQRPEATLEPAVFGRADGGADLGLQLTGAGHEVVVAGGVQGGGDAPALPLRAVQVLRDVAEGIDGDRLAALQVGDQEAAVAQLWGAKQVDLGRRAGHPRIMAPSRVQAEEADVLPA